MKTFLKKIIFITLFFSYPLLSGNENAVNTQSNHLISLSEGIKSPLRLCTGSDNSIFVTDYVKKVVCRYDSSGNLTGTVKLNFPPLCIASYHGEKLYVGDAGSGRIFIFNLDGTLIKSFGLFEQPADAVFDDNDLLYVTDTKNNCVSVYSADGIFQKSFGNNILNFPTGITFDRENQRILVAEHGGITPPDSSAHTASIHIFNKNGEWLGRFGGYGSKEGEFTRIQGLTVDRLGRIYAVDSYQGMVTVLDESGNFIERIGEYGYSEGQLRLPMDLILDSRGRLWITSLNSGRIEIFKVNDIPTEAGGEAGSSIPLHTELLQNYPNPFNPGTQIPFIIGRNENVSIRIYNLTGQIIRTINLGNLRAGRYTAKGRSYYWDGMNASGKQVASGFYFYELRTDSYTKIRRMLLLK